MFYYYASFTIAFNENVKIILRAQYCGLSFIKIPAGFGKAASHELYTFQYNDDIILQNFKMLRFLLLSENNYFKPCGNPLLIVCCTWERKENYCDGRTGN